jgi:hypothetical protein
MAMPTNIAATTAYAAAAHPPIFGPNSVRLSPAATLATMQKITATTVIKLGAFVDFTFLPPAGKCLKTDHFTTNGHLISKEKWFHGDEGGRHFSGISGVDCGNAKKEKCPTGNILRQDAGRRSEFHGCQPDGSTTRAGTAPSGQAGGQAPFFRLNLCAFNLFLIASLRFRFSFTEGFS